MHVTLLYVPYDSAYRGLRMGAGPEHLRAAGLADHLEALGHDVETQIVAHEAEMPAEVATGFDLMARVSAAVSRAVRAGRLPVVLSGNCNVCVGTMSGLDEDTGLIWFDAHGDFNTPETTPSGFFDGMGLAVLVGRCWQPLAATVPGFKPMPEANAVLAGAHALDPLERAALEASGIVRLAPDALRDGASLHAALARLAERTRGLYLHLDPDVIDSSYGRANTYAAPGGISPEVLLEAVETVGRSFPLRAVGVASYDPVADETGAIGEVIRDVLTAVVTMESKAS